MNESIIIRIANQYKQWVDTASTKPINIKPLCRALREIGETSAKTSQWLERYISGVTPKVQNIPYSDEQQIGIVCQPVYTNILTHLISDLTQDMSNNLQFFEATMRNTTSSLSARSKLAVSLQDAMEEIRVIVGTWDKVTYERGILSVLVKNIILNDENEDVDLGDFEIRIDPSDPLSSLQIHSIDLIESSTGYYHPHVSEEKLCEGEGGPGLRSALYQGRLEDFFRLVEIILRTYNESSVHTPLDEWYDPNHDNQFYCDNCEAWRDNDDNYWCNNCQENYCRQCDPGGADCTGCGEWQCGECLTMCADCEECACSSCVTACNRCGDSVCYSCQLTCDACLNINCSRCVQDCVFCADSICTNCQESCPNCDDINCSTCTDESCLICCKYICKHCQTNCKNCDELICTTCAENACNDCGCSMCKECQESHKCLLSEIKNA